MSEYSEAMKQVVRIAHPLLKDAGFRKRRNTFNRATELGLVQVLNFRMGRHPVGPHPHGDYGKFTIDVGIWIREIHERLSSGSPVPSFVAESSCELRMRLADLIPEAELPRDETGLRWWSLDEPPLKTAQEIRSVVIEYAFPFFERLRTRAGFVQEVQREDRRSGYVPRAPLSIAVIEFESGEVDAAERRLRAYAAARRDRPSYRFIVEVAAGMGITI